MLHVTVMMLSYASLIVGSLLSIFFLVLAKNQTSNLAVQGNSYGDMFANRPILILFFMSQIARYLPQMRQESIRQVIPKKKKFWKTV